MGLNVVSGVVSTVADIGKDEAWLRDWLREQPGRMGLGELRTVDGEAPETHPPTFVAIDDARVFSIGVRLGELEAADAFGVLQGWASSRAHEPEKDHVAVLVTERLPEPYRGTLEALAERLPMVVVGLSVWQGESEAIIVPHVALASSTLDLAGAPAAAAAMSMAAVQAEAESVAVGQATDASAGAAETSAEAMDADAAASDSTATEPGDTDPAEASDEAPGGAEPASQPDGDPAPTATDPGAEAQDEDPFARLGSRDDTGVADPWGLSGRDGEGSLLKGSYSEVGSR